MKKITSILISLAMVFTLFSAVPAFAETEYEGTFNIPYEAKMISENQELYLNLTKGTVTSTSVIKVTAKYGAANSSGSNPWNNGTAEGTTYYDTNFGKDVINETRIRIYPLHTQTKEPTDWLTNSAVSYIQNGQIWHISKVTIDGKTVYETDKETNAVARFSTQNKKQVNSTTVADGATDVPVDTAITFDFSNRYYFSSRGETSTVTVTEDGNPLTGGGVDFSFSNSGATTGNTAYSDYTLTPIGGSWKPGRTYNVKVKVTDPTYTETGELGEPVTVLEHEITFTTAGEKTEEPEPEPEPEPELEPLTGTFNIPDLTEGISNNMPVYFNLNRALTDAEAKKITVNGYGYTAADHKASSDPWGQTSTEAIEAKGRSAGFEVTADKKSIRVFAKNVNTGEEAGWLASSTPYGWIWKIKVAVNEEQLGVINFHTAGKKNYTATTNFPAEGEVAALDEIFTMSYEQRTYWSGRGETYSFELKEGDAVLEKDTDYTIAYDATNKKFTLAPITAWNPGKTYTATVTISSLANYAADGTLLEGYAPLYTKTWTFNTEVPEVTYDNEPQVTFADGVATITNNTASDLTDAILILVAKDKTTKIFNNLVTQSISVASKNSATVNFAVANDEEFDFFLLDKKLAPIISK